MLPSPSVHLSYDPPDLTVHFCPLLRSPPTGILASEDLGGTVLVIALHTKLFLVRSTHFYFLICCCFSTVKCTDWNIAYFSCFTVRLFHISTFQMNKKKWIKNIKVFKNKIEEVIYFWDKVGEKKGFGVGIFTCIIEKNSYLQSPGPSASKDASMPSLLFLFTL